MFKDMYLELVGTFPDLPVPQTKRFINRAQRDAYDAWNWSFLAGVGSLNIPTEVITGLAGFTQNSQIVQVDSSAAAVWQTLGSFIPITQRSLKVGVEQPYNILAFDGVDTVYIDRPYTGISSTLVAATATITPGFAGNPIDGTNLFIGGSVFTWVNVVIGPTDVLIGGTTAISFQNMVDAINADPEGLDLSTAVLAGTTITLTARSKGPDGNSIYLSINAAYGAVVLFHGGGGGTSYLLYRPYYAAPSDFQKWVSVVDTTDAWNLIPGKKKEWLDLIDPQRSTIGGPAQFIAFYKLQRAQTIPVFGVNTDPVVTDSQLLFELWPAPTAAMSLTTYYKKRGADMVADTDTSPFEDGLLISRALCLAYRFVQVNAVRFAKTTGDRVNWTELKKDANADYMYELGNAVKRDDNVRIASIIGSNACWAPSSSWLQRHVTWGQYSQAYAGSYNY